MDESRRRLPGSTRRKTRRRIRPSRPSRLLWPVVLLLPALSYAFSPLFVSSKASRIALRTSNYSSRPLGAGDGLSKYYQSILSRTIDRQRFVTGRYPLTVSVVENPTKKWLRSESSTEILVNGTAPDRSLASIDRFHWLEDEERNELLSSYAMFSMEFIAEIHVDRPGYLQILPDHAAGATAALERRLKVPSWNRWKESPSILAELEGIRATKDRLWVTGFSLGTSKGILKCVDNEHITSVNDRTSLKMLWPNEVQYVPNSLLKKTDSTGSEPALSSVPYSDALVISDGFLVPGKDRGGIYVVRKPGTDLEWTVSLTNERANRWFYHRSTWVDLTGDGRQSLLTARCKVSPQILSNNQGVTSGITKQGELIWLECPKPYTRDPKTGTPLEEDGTVFDPFGTKHLPWKEHVLCSGPDVMFSIADMDLDDCTIEVISSQFFAKRVVCHSIKRGPRPRVVLEKVIDDQCGSPFGCILADLECKEAIDFPRVVDSGSTVETLQKGDAFSHVLVTSHESAFVDSEKHDRYHRTSAYPKIHTDPKGRIDGGSLFAYRIPKGRGAWRKEPWQRTTIATGFKVKGQWSNIINPGAPGFVYTFHANKESSKKHRPMIAVAGDCAASAYIFRPDTVTADASDSSTAYMLMVEIQSDATVGSIGIGYGDFTETPQESGYAKLYIPCYERDKVLVFALGSGNDDLVGSDDNW